jgi:O-antigen/teichoic acid export membrane protein
LASLSTVFDQVSDTEVSRAALLRRLVLRGGLLSLVVRVAGVLLAYAAHILLSRLLGLQEYGRYAIALGWAMVLAMPSRIGFDYSALRYATIYLQDRDWSAFHAFVRTALIAIICASTLVAGTVVLIGSIAGIAGFTLLMAIAGVIVATALISFLSVMMRSAQRIFSSQFYDQALRPAAIILILIALSRMADDRLGAADAMVVTAAGAAIATIALGIEFGHAFRHAWRATPNFSNYRAWVRVSLPLLMIMGVQELMNQLQVIMLGWLADAPSAGLYAAAWRLASLIGFGLAALGTLSGPLVASAYHRGEFEELTNISRLTARLAVSFALPAAVVLLVWGRVLLSLFGPEFIHAYPVLLVLVAGGLVNASTGIVAYLLTLTGREVQALAILVGALAINFGLNLVLIPRQGALGAAVASVVTLASWNLLMLVTVRRGLGVDASLLGLRFRAP